MKGALSQLKQNKDEHNSTWKEKLEMLKKKKQNFLDDEDDELKSTILMADSGMGRMATLGVTLCCEKSAAPPKAAMKMMSRAMP